MGQTSSSPPRGSEHSPKKSHYELLGLRTDVSDEDIKKAYRRKALELHPDRNFGKEEEATKLFSEVQAAYEVLSDPRERAWYDAHREDLFRGSPETAEDHFERSVRVTTAEEIRQMLLQRSNLSNFSDSPAGFFSVIRDLFDRLALEETIASEIANLETPDYPSFGSAEDGYVDVVKPFYARWSVFSTEKKFAWKDVYHYSEAGDRRTRRAMERENKRSRDDAIREFNDAVRALVAFVKRRDPRYRVKSQTDEERQQALRDAAAAQAAKARAANQAKIAENTVPEWAKSGSREEAEETEPSDEESTEVFECVICNKIFKSENQYEGHERSKKHKQAVQKITIRMRKENKTLGLDDNGIENLPDIKSSDEEIDLAQDLQNKSRISGDIQNGNVSASNDTSFEIQLESQSPSISHSSDIDLDQSTDEYEEYTLASEVEERVPGNSELGDGPSKMSNMASNLDEPNPLGTKKKGKAKEKRATRAAKAAGMNTLETTCATCSNTFPSKTQLFKHIKISKHQAPPLSRGK